MENQSLGKNAECGQPRDFANQENYDDKFWHGYAGIAKAAPLGNLRARKSPALAFPSWFVFRR
jgi:hypothetical protein